jgi:Eco57I restriction-modification methylase
MSSKKSRASAQLSLAIQHDEQSASVVCRSIFSLNYLKEHFAKSEGFPTTEDARPIYERLKKRWLEDYVGLSKRKEAYTRTQFLDPLLNEIGWTFIPEQDLPSKGVTRKRPDYCCFLNDETRQRAAKESDTADVFREAATVLEAKKAQHSLDEISEEETPGWFPSQQVQNYLHNAKDKTGQRYFNWAILTNGNEWRLYCEQAPTDACFAFHLAHGEEFCSLEDFRLFVALFRPQSFEPDEEQRCLLDKIREESLTRQAELESNLRKRIFDVLEDLANGFRDYSANEIAKKDFPALYDNSLIFLYRLLFGLYAESRGLLPVKPSGYGSSKIYREKFSLARLVKTLREKNSFSSEAFTELYDDLIKLFRLINGDKPGQNEECKVTRYNGGLFNPQLHPRIEQWRVSDNALANVLRQLIFAQPPARSSARQQQISTDETIDYGLLEVRQLGDIYEGLLGAILEVNDKGRLELRNANGENHRHGIFYTPDWVVRYFIREALQPLIDEIEKQSEVQAALNAKSDEKKRNNSFALAVLRLNVCDPAMGSGHFVVRTTEWLADQIVYHPTTRTMTEKIVVIGDKRRSRADILKDNRIPVPPGASQEQAEIAYWRRRVVEACIYGVDVNPLAVELAKLSLWLTCIAADEPLNFLDHHLRTGNSLLWANPDEMRHLPVSTEAERKQITFNLGEKLSQAVKAVIAENHAIEETASTEMELVKKKETRWKAVREKLRPFLYFADVWLAALDGLPVNELNYQMLARAELEPGDLDNKEKADAKKLRESLAADIETKRTALNSFHWRLEFPDVFFQTDGQPRPEAACGFDAFLGNPPYISTHTSSAESWRDALEKRAGYLEDLYVHFTDLGFQLLRPGGRFGFIVSDTFFTLASKARMRVMLQTHGLNIIGQCDPFDATVDAAIFVACKATPNFPADGKETLFVQARPRKVANDKPTKPEKDLPTLKSIGELKFSDSTKLAGGTGEVQHGEHGCLRFHRVPSALWRDAHKRVFFEPRPGTLRLFEKFNEPVKELVGDWWQKVETSQKFADNHADISAYHKKLKPGDVTLVGLIAEGGQGMRTANNARFLGFLQGTPQAEKIKASRDGWTKRWLTDAEIKSVFLGLLAKNGGDSAKPTRNVAAWETCVEPLKEKFSLVKLGFTKSDLYRIVLPDLVAAPDDFKFAWQSRKAELLKHWRTKAALKDFWEGDLGMNFDRKKLDNLRTQKEISDAEFCELCQELQAWVKEKRKPWKLLGLRSAENYDDSADAPRIATIYNGLYGHSQFVPFRKGDPEGNRWIDNEPLFIHWSTANAIWLFENSGRPESRMPVIRNAHLYFTSGVTWSLHANHVAVKARFQQPCVFDASGSRLTPFKSLMTAEAFLAILNSDVFSFFLKKFIKHNQDVEINDVRMMPLVMPTRGQEKRLKELAERAMEAKRLRFAGATPPNELVAAVRGLSDELAAKAPAYLRPSAQLKLLHTAADCLAAIELAVNWEAEKLYGVEGLGPFDEF